MSKTPKEDRFARGSWIALGAAILIVALSVVQTAYRVSRPTDGWSFQRDLSGTGQRLVFDRNFVAAPSTLATGDELLAVEGRPIASLLAQALILTPVRLDGWEVGRTVSYSVRRDGRDLRLDVPLRQLDPSQLVREVALNWLNDPSTLPFAVLAFVVFLRRPGGAPARLMLLLGASVFASNGISQAVSGSNVLGPTEIVDRGAYWPGVLYDSWIWPLLIAPVYLHLFLRFPVVKSPLRTHPRLVLAALYGALPLGTLLLMLLNLGRPLDFWRAWATLSSLDFFVILFAAVATIGHTLLTEHGAVGRAQIRWVAWGTLVTTLGALAGGLLVTLGLLGASSPADLVLHRLPLLAFPVSLAIAILRYRLFEIDVVINRTLVGTLLTLTLALIYVASVLAMQQVFQAVIGQQSDVAVVVSTLAIVVLFQPLRRQIQRFVDRLFYRQKYDAARVLAAFGATVRDEVDLSTLTAALLAVVEETMQPAHASLMLRRPSQRSHRGWNMAIPSGGVGAEAWTLWQE